MIYLLFDPLAISLLIFTVQGLVWWYFMPVTPDMPGTAPKYVGETALTRYFLFLAVWLLALLWGHWIASGVHGRGRRGAAPGPADPARRAEHFRQAEYLWKVAKVALAVSVVGELVYVRQLIANPSLLIANLEGGYLAGVAGEINQQSVGTASTLVNLWPVPCVIFAAFAFNAALPASLRRKARNGLWGMGAWAFAQSIVLSARMIFIYFLLILTAAFLLQGTRGKRPLRLLAGVGVGAVLIVWLGETLRTGFYYATVSGKSAFSPEIQGLIWTHLIEGYFASDFNNAQILMGCPPSMTFVRSAVSIAGLASKLFGLPMYGYDYYCPEFVSAFATINVFGLWWFDAGWFGLLYALALGVWIGYTYHTVVRQPSVPSFNLCYYLITFPGIISLTRLNYFGLNIFIRPAFFLMMARTFAPRKKALES
jgi:hypothetical protein